MVSRLLLSQAGIYMLVIYFGADERRVFSPGKQRQGAKQVGFMSTLSSKIGGNSRFCKQLRQPSGALHIKPKMMFKTLNEM